MSDSKQNRFEIDLEEIERQLRRSVEAASVPPPQSRPNAPASPAPPLSSSDPLAELARIVGQDDPFRGILGDVNRPEPARPAATPAVAHNVPHLTAEERGILGGDPPASGPVLSASRGEVFDPVTDAYGSLEDAVDGRDYEPLPPRRSRARLVGVMLALILVAAGVAATLMWRRSGSNFASTGVPPLIKADNAPLKIAPENPGGMDIPNQNRQIYDRGAPDGKSRVVNRQEQPIDVREAARSMPQPDTPEVSATLSPPAAPSRSPTQRSGPSAADAPPTAAASGPAPAVDPRPNPTVSASVASNRAPNAVTSVLGEPHRVRTVTVRPDGTIAPTGTLTAADVPQLVIPTGSLPPPVQVSTVSIPVGQLSSPQTPSAPASTTSPGSATSASSTPPVTVLPPERPRLASAAPAANATETAQSVAAPIPEPTPVGDGTPAPGQVAVSVRPPARPGNLGERVASVADPALPSAAVAADAAGRNFVVQIATRNTEQEAQAAYTQLADKYQTDLGGKPAAIAQGEVRGKAVYRVRVGPLSRSDANTLCTRLKSSGGACFVAAE